MYPKVIYIRLIACTSMTNEPSFKSFVLSDYRKAKLYSKMLVVASRPCFHVEEKIDKHTQIQALDNMQKRWPIFLFNILDVIQRPKLYVIQRMPVL